MSRLIRISAVAAGVVLATAGAASAGEVNGKGKDIPAPEHAASECVFSGLDTLDSVEQNPLPELDDDALAVRGNQSPGGMDRYHGVQNYGIFVKAGLKEFLPSPGQACNPSAG
ncbi:hypothetical protein [Nocardioides baculatus]|uniref:Secreted protein n=1 Tax=Nocardioides baculatus TaxID=2801337 RepID=A0ABS1LE18_9ACTN|nr:hypothetical protein [Nocardioides baculatus]MBL0749914.1 hypothetical protein [Nocardioides baculatus]